MVLKISISYNIYAFLFIYCSHNIDLNLFQLACKPRLLDKEEAAKDNTVIDMATFDKLKEGILCPVCTDVYKNP